MEIQKHKTAISRSKASIPTKWAYNEGLINENSTVFDWGCGKGKDSEWLREKRCNVISFDPYYSPDKNPDNTDFSNVDVIICNYVINVIESKKERVELIDQIFDKGLNSRIIISCRPENQINKDAEKNNWKIYNDGFVTSRNTFQKGYSIDGLKELIESGTSRKMTNSYKVSSGIVCVY